MKLNAPLVSTASVLGLALASVSLAGPPPTEVRPVTETLHGVEMTDDYRWLEGDNSDPDHMGVLTDEVAAWTDAQNAYTREVLDGLQPHRARLEARLRELMEIGSVGTPRMALDRYFYSKREGTEAQSVIFVRDGLDSQPRELLNPNTLDTSGLLTVSWYTPSHDGELMAFGMYSAGDENSVLYVMEVDTGVWLAEEIPGKVRLIGWTPDRGGFFYRRLADLDNPYSGQIKYHRMGTHHRQDKLLFEQANYRTLYEGHGFSESDLEGFATTWGPFAFIDREARWMVLGYYRGTSQNDLWAVDLDRWFRTGEFDLTEIVVGEPSTSSGQIVGDDLYMETSVGSPNGRLVRVDLTNPAAEGWQDIVPERPDAVMQSVDIARGVMAVEFLKDASTLIELFSLDGQSRGQLELPGIGSAGLSTSDDRTEAFLTYTSFNEPRSIYRIDLATGERELWERPDVPVDPSIVEVKQVWYSSADGTRVPMFIIHKKGLELDGTNPTILYGYGGFNISMRPRFSATLFPWFEAGGVYAVANLRGGGEYGESWHKAGMLAEKQNVFDDFYAAGEWLIENGYTTPERLGIAGGSNGGLLTGVAVTQRPDLFAAAIVAVPLLDMLRYQNFLMAKYWVPEYGSSEDEAQFQFISAYSPYHNVKPGTKYPAVLLTAGENDSRVHPLHARKMAAILQAATASDPDEAPVLVWVDREAGHGQGKPLHLRIRDVADQRLFMMWQLGMFED